RRHFRTLRVHSGRRRRTTQGGALVYSLRRTWTGPLAQYPPAMRTDRGWKRFYATGWLVSVLIGAAAVHQWQGRVRAVEERLAEAERTREAVVQRVAADERLRIARELHDSLSHSISVIKVQAGVAVHLARKRGQEVPEALAAIQEAAGDAAAELRETLRVLRRADERGEPVRGVGPLPELVRRAQDRKTVAEGKRAGRRGRPGSRRR